MQLRSKLHNALNWSLRLFLLLTVGCAAPSGPTLNPLSQLNYSFVQVQDYRIQKISSKLRLAAYSQGYTLPPALSPLVIREPKPVVFSLATGEVILSDSLLSEITDEAQLAAIIAHEYSHKLLNHFENLQSSSDINMVIEPKLEFAADELSLKLIKAADYPEIAALKALQILHRRIRREVSSDWNEILDQREQNLASLINN